MYTDRDQFLKECEEFEARYLTPDTDPYPTSDPLRDDRETELAKDIYSAAVGARFPKAAIAQVAKYHGLSLDLVEDIAKQLVQQRVGYDLEEEEFTTAIRQVKWLEEHVDDAGLRAWKMQCLARKFKRTVHQLQEAYSKALVNQAPIEPMSIAEFRVKNRGRVQWLVPGWIPAATTLLIHGDGGAGKTLFVYQLIEAVVSTGNWNGYQTAKGPVLLVQTDEPELVTNDRMDMRNIPDDSPLTILSDWQAEALPRLASYIEKHRPKLIVIDSLSTINKNCIFSENDAEYARPLLHLRDLADEYECAIVVIHHSSAMGRVRGSTAIKNSVSEVWAMRNGQGLDERVLAVEKTRMGRPPGRYRFLFESEDFSYRYLGEETSDGEDAEDTSTQEERIRLWLASDDRAGIPWTPTEIAEFMGVSKNSARRCLYELWAKGLVNRHRSKQVRSYAYYTGELRNFVDSEAVTVEQMEVI
ncbi:MAG: AAA family ATPase [Leptolyngbya sp. SIO4C1]|nr:AAA family ATPase [Leptolyngbya sp. SIO4C1]